MAAKSSAATSAAASGKHRLISWKDDASMLDVMRKLPLKKHNIDEEVLLLWCAGIVDRGTEPNSALWASYRPNRSMKTCWEPPANPFFCAD